MNWEIGVIRGMEVLFLGIGSYFDIKTRKLPLGFLVFFAGVGMLFNLVWNYQSTEELVFGIVFGSLFFVISKLTKEAIGYGDAWGILILSIFEGGRRIVPIVLVAFLLSSVYGLYKMIRFKMNKRDTLPFFPFVFLAMLGGFSG